MSPLLWDPTPKPPERPDDLVFAFVVLTFAMWLVVVVGMIARG